MKQSLLKQANIFCLSLGVSLAVFVSTAWGQFQRVQPWVSPDIEIKVPEDYKTYLVEAMKIHAIQYQLNNLMMTTHPNMLLSEKQMAIKQAQMDALNSCNVNRLSSVYINPEEAWQNIKNEYDRQEKEIKIYINAAEPATQENEADLAFPHWRIGRDVLIDVYAHPEKYGEVNGVGEESGFKRWKDQEHIYVEQVNHFLEDVVRILGVHQIPGVNRNNSYEQNAAAYQAFLERIKVSDAQKYAQLSEEMRVFPQPPAPLPPANEIVKLTQESSEGKLFPSMPEPWQEYTKNQNIKRLPDGEMNEYYQPDSLKLRVEVGDKTLNNRLAAYQTKKDEFITTQRTLSIHREADEYLVNDVKSSLSELQIDVPVDLENLSPLRDELVKRKRAAIRKAQELIQEQADYETSQTSDRLNKFRSLTMQEKLKALNEIDRDSPEYSQALNLLNSYQGTQDEVFLNALEKDINGTTVLSVVNAKDVDLLMKGAEAQNALAETVYAKQEEEIEKQKKKKIDVDCMNGGL